MNPFHGKRSFAFAGAGRCVSWHCSVPLCARILSQKVMWMYVLVSFHGNAHWGLFDHVQMRLDLEDIFKRKVDLVTRRALEQSQNSLLRARILDTAKVIFADNEAVYAEG